LALGGRIGCGHQQQRAQQDDGLFEAHVDRSPFGSGSAGIVVDRAPSDAARPRRLRLRRSGSGRPGMARILQFVLVGLVPDRQLS
ncbi:MAG TPA: hypothetical protein VGB99_02770, partial [Acidobacteriota bacterium]